MRPNTNTPVIAISISSQAEAREKRDRPLVNHAESTCKPMHTLPVVDGTLQPRYLWYSKLMTHRSIAIHSPIITAMAGPYGQEQGVRGGVGGARSMYSYNNSYP